MEVCLRPWRRGCRDITTFPDCSTEITLTGCELLAPCVTPANFDECRLDMSSCVDVYPGSTCEVRCRAPYTGEAAVAMCPPENVDPELVLLVVDPLCELE